MPFTAAALVAAARGLKLRALALNGSAPAPIGEFDKTLSKLAEALGPSLESLSLRSCVRLGSAVRRRRGRGSCLPSAAASNPNGAAQARCNPSSFFLATP